MLHGQTRYPMRSRFLSEVPEQHLKWLTPKQQASFDGYGGEPRWAGASRNPTSSRPTVAPRTPTSGVLVGSQHFRIGQGVNHGRFGEGTIIGLSGSGMEAQAQIQFRDAGTKTLALGIAKLDITQG